MANRSKAIDASGIDTKSVRAELAGCDVPCWECGYNLRDCQQGVCPECGTVISVRSIRLAMRRPFDREAKQHYTFSMVLLASGTLAFGALVVADVLTLTAWLGLILLVSPLLAVVGVARQRAVRRLALPEVRPSHCLPLAPLVSTVCSSVYAAGCLYVVIMWLATG